MTRSGNTRNGKYMGEDKRRYHTITNILQYNLIPDFFTIFAKYCITFKNMTMEKTFAQISELFDQFSKDASLQVEKEPVPAKHHSNLKNSSNVSEKSHSKPRSNFYSGLDGMEMAA